VNCVRTAPWVREISGRYAGEGFFTLGIHTPELEHERDRDAVAQNARRLGLEFPHLVDPDYSYWRALDNQYWPTVYLVDRCGRIRGRWIGEIHSGRSHALRAEALLRRLLGEGPGCGT
jgi:hypothetical protein